MKRALTATLITGLLALAAATPAGAQVQVVQAQDCMIVGAHSGRQAPAAATDIYVAAGQYQQFPFWYGGSSEDGRWYVRWWAPDVISKVLWRVKNNPPWVSNFSDWDVVACFYE
jgi:hypothetical protein